MSGVGALQERIRTRSARIAVWGAGYVGLSSALAFARAGFRCLAIDIDPGLVDCLNRGLVPLPGFADWVGIDVAPLLGSDRFGARTRPEPAELEAADVHLVCVSTDRQDRPDSGALESVMETLAPVLATPQERIVSVESTVAATWLDRLLRRWPGLEARHLHLAVAPRRDWFQSPELNLRTLPRIVGCRDQASRELVAQLYHSVCDEVLMAADWRHAALVKAVENTLRYVGIVLANQLASALPDCDIAEVMELAATKWNVPHYLPSVGIGGYCVPLAPHYLLESVRADQDGDGLLPLVRQAVQWDEGYADVLASMIARQGVRSVGILGVSYAPNLRIFKRSAALRLAAALRRLGVAVEVHDPQLSLEDLGELFDVPVFRYPDDLSRFPVILLATRHDAYRDLPRRLQALERPPLVIDNLGQMRDEFEGCSLSYRAVGTPFALAPDGR